MSDRVSLVEGSKRQFLRTCLCVMGGTLFGFSQLERLLGSYVDPLPSRTDQDGPGKWSKEALYYTRVDNAILCVKCPHECVLDSGEVGKCRNRVNYEGKLYSIAYGNPCAVHVDPVEKKPFFHFLPATRAFSLAIAGCNLRCLNCQNWEISQVSPRETSNYDLMPPKAVEECLSSKSESIAYTYSEPTTFYEYVLDTATIARTKKIKNLLKSSGYINEEPLRKLCAVLDGANIDLKSFDDGTYKRLSEARLAPVLRTLQVLREEGVWLEITALVVPNWTDDLGTIRRMCDWLVSNGMSDVPLHFSRFSPLYKLVHLPATPVSTLERARDIGMKAGIKYVYLGNVPGHAAENTYCHHCGKEIIERKGFFVGEIHLVKGKCQYCREKIPGVWA